MALSILLVFFHNFMKILAPTDNTRHLPIIVNFRIIFHHLLMSVVVAVMIMNAMVISMFLTEIHESI